MMDSNIELEPGLRNAVQEAEETKTITPLLKQELKYTILNRRHKTGKGDLNLHEEKPYVKRELTDEERKKKLRRKEQNRRAAQRCREKKKKLSDQVLTDYIEEQRTNDTLTKVIQQLMTEKAELQRILDEHMFNCARAVTPTPVTPNQTPSFDDQTTFNFPFTCPTPSPYGNEPECVRDQNAQYGDPFDAVCMYPNATPQEMMSKENLPEMTSKDNFPYLPNLCTISAEDLPELEIPEDFSLLQEACSPVLQAMGRQSISEFPEETDCIPY